VVAEGRGEEREGVEHVRVWDPFIRSEQDFSHWIQD
jgi:hypothetical protein